MTPANVTGWIDSLDFGLNPCGGVSTDKTFTLTNSGGTAAKIITATLAGGYTTDAADKTVPANGTLVVRVTAAGIPQVSATPGSYAGSLTLKTDAPGDVNHVVALSQGALGAILTFEAAVDFGSFGSVAASSMARQTFKLTNTGNADAMLNAGSGTPFVVDSPSLVILKGQSVDSGVTFDASTPVGLIAGGHSGTLSFAATSTVCSAPLSGVSLTATTLNGGIAISRGATTFWPACNDNAPAAETVTLTNTGNTPIQFSAKLRETGLFTISPLADTIITVPATSGQNTATIAVTPVPVTTHATLQDALIITTSGVTGDSPHVVPLRTEPQGDVVVASSSGGTDFGQVPILPTPQSASLQILFRNDANPSTGLGIGIARVSLTNSNPGRFTLDATAFEIQPLTSRVVTVTFAPGTDKAILQGAPSAVFATNIGWSIGSDVNCYVPNGAGGTVALQATATAAEVVVQPSALVFGNGGLVNCGARGQPIDILLSNPGANAYTVSNLQLSGEFYDAVLSGAVVAAGGTQKITVVPRPIPAVVNAVPDGTTAKPTGRFNGSISFQTDAPNDTPHVVPLYMGAKGVIIATPAPPSQSPYVFEKVAVGGTSYFAFNVTNRGNAAALTNFSAESTVFGLSPNPTVLPAGALDSLGEIPGTLTKVNLIYRPVLAPATDNDTGRVAIAPATGEVFCVPLTSAWVDLATNGRPLLGSSQGN